MAPHTRYHIYYSSGGETSRVLSNIHVFFTINFGRFADHGFSFSFSRGFSLQPRSPKLKRYALLKYFSTRLSGQEYLDYLDRATNAWKPWCLLHTLKMTMETNLMWSLAACLCFFGTCTLTIRIFFQLLTTSGRTHHSDSESETSQQGMTFRSRL